MALFFAFSNTWAVFHVLNQWKNEEIIDKSWRINHQEIDLAGINIWGWDG